MKQISIVSMWLDVVEMIALDAGYGYSRRTPCHERTSILFTTRSIHFNYANENRHNECIVCTVLRAGPRHIYFEFERTQFYRAINTPTLHPQHTALQCWERIMNIDEAFLITFESLVVYYIFPPARNEILRNWKESRAENLIPEYMYDWFVSNFALVVSFICDLYSHRFTRRSTKTK